VLVVFSFTATAQKINPWQPTTASQVQSLTKVNRSSSPSTYQLFTLDLATFRSQLVGAPMRGSFNGRSQQEILLPNASGTIERYHVMETPCMEKELADRYPMIKSYAAQGVDDPTAVARFTVTQFGLHSMTFSSGKSTVFIDPYTEDRLHYIVYQKSDLVGGVTNFECLTDEALSLPSSALDRNAFDYSIFNTDDNTLRTYRLAQSCTAEYGNIFAGAGTLAQQKANIQAQMTITMTRVNGVYEIDLGITMIFVANNDAIIYLGATNSDPWSNEWNTKTAQTIDAVIGVTNYDIGHNFNTTGGGNAGCIACVCQSVSQAGTHKGRGYTGRSNPTGDAFDIDYVAHEMGHQFGGYHTQSNSSCRSGSGLTEVEPGSASTIMGYAGICAADVQSNSDAYFAHVNIRDILAYVKSGTGSCSVNTPISNQTPVVEAGLNYTIPKSTAFVLTAVGSDPDNDVLTYTWEQNDPGNPNSNAAPTSTRTVGPMFRSITGTTSPSRYFPAMATILTGATSNTWEVVPSVARALNFSVVARDNIAGGGQTKSDLMSVTVNGTAGPFLVNSPNTNVSWIAGSNQTVTWDVAGTTANGVNCANVDIYLSQNGGSSFPILLASKVPNDGSETVSIPATTGAQNRIMVKGNNTIFLDVSNTNFTVATTTPTFALTFDGQLDGQNKSVCQGQEATYSILYSTIGGFSGTTTFSVTGNPAGTTATLTPTTLSADGTVQLQLSNTGTAVPGVYQMVVTGTSGAITKTVNLYVEVLNSSFATMNLTNPLDLANGVLTTVTLTWDADAAATNYDIQVATDEAFTNLVVSTNVLTNSYALSGLSDATNYFWRVLPKNSGCQGSMSAVNRFTTAQTNCSTFTSTNVPIAIPTTVTTVNSTLIIPTGQNQVIQDLTVNVNLTHTWINDLVVTLISPTGTQVRLVNRPCSNSSTFQNANAVFSATGVTLVCAAQPATAISGTIIPNQAFSAFTGQNTQGTWTLRVQDAASGDGGSINSWSLNFCVTNTAPLPCGAITTTWNGSSWSNGRPVNNVAATIAGNYTSDGDLACCSLAVTNTAQVTLQSGHNLIVSGAITVAGTSAFTVENNANLIQLDDVANTGNITVHRNTSPLMRLDYAMWSTPVTGSQTLKQFSNLTLNNRFYTYGTSGNVYTVVSDPANTPFAEGTGYLIRMPDNHPATPTVWSGQFTGIPKNGSIDVPLTYLSGTQKYNAIGNPYPSTIRAESFLNANQTDLEGIVYFWRKTNNAAGTAYASYTLGGATTTSPTSPIPNGTIQVGQGFIVAAKNVTTPMASFTNDLRVDNNNNQFFRSAFGLPYLTETTMERHRIWLNLTNDAGLFSQMMVGYMSSATNEVDAFIDGKYIGDSDTALSSLLAGEEYVIQGRVLPFEATDVVPLVFKTSNAGSFMISLGAFDGLFEGDQAIYLRDNLLGIVHDLREAGYSFETEAGVFNNRFDLLYENVTLGVGEDTYSNSVQVATGGSQLKIKSTVEPLSKITVYDVLGRTLFQSGTLQQQEFVVPGLTPLHQALFVKIVMNNGQAVLRKVVF